MELLYVFRHMITCAQSQKTRHNHLNWRFLVVPQVLWGMYAANILLDSYPIPPADLGETTTYGLGTPLGLAVTKDLHTKENKYWKVDQNTNRALTERFLSIFSVKHCEAYHTLLIDETNQRFGVTFQYFYDLFGTHDEREMEVNRDNMESPWNTQIRIPGTQGLL